MRLREKFNSLRKEGKKVFIAYVPFGFPAPSSTKAICQTLEQAGVDIIELGIPFSDPLADGVIIQKATAQALKRGANLDIFLKTLQQIVTSVRIPIVIMTYYNPILQFGLSDFFKKISRIGVQAVLIVDVPVEENSEYIKAARKFNIDTVFFVTPTTSPSRIKKIVRYSRGFIYYISVTGITGPKELQFRSIAQHVKSVKRSSKVPVCVGFGIHTRTQVKTLNAFSDGVIVGSSIVNFIDKHYREPRFLKKLHAYVRSLCMR